jgi:hypothetical protein
VHNTDLWLMEKLDLDESVLFFPQLFKVSMELLCIWLLKYFVSLLHFSIEKF